MSDYTKQVLIIAAYNLTILFLCTYLVLFFGFSAWWYLAAVMIFGNTKKDQENA